MRSSGANGGDDLRHQQPPTQIHSIHQEIELDYPMKTGLEINAPPEPAETFAPEVSLISAGNSSRVDAACATG